MNEEYRQKLINYRITMTILKGLLSDGTITREEYQKIDTNMLEKYSISSSTLFC